MSDAALDLSLADRIRALPRAVRAQYLARPDVRSALAALWAERDPRLFLRPSRALPSPSDLARIELILGGRGAGKTQWAVWLFLQLWTRGYARRLRIIVATIADVDELLYGESGICTWLPHRWAAYRDRDAGAFVRGKGHAGVLDVPGLPAVACLSCEKPGSGTSQNVEVTLFDDPDKCTRIMPEARVRSTFIEARVSTRVGPNPCVIVPTVPDGVGFMRRAFSGNMAGVHKRNFGGAKGNTALSAAYLADVLDDLMLEGDQSQLDGIERTDRPGALWRRAWIDAHRVPTAPDLARVVVAVDPADDGREDSDETGIVVVGLGHDARLYVLADYTALHDATAWPAICAWAMREWKADGIAAEMNRARSLVRRCISIEAPFAPVLEVDATRSKQTRAEPLAMAYRDGHVSHVNGAPQVQHAGAHELTVEWYDPQQGRRMPRKIVVQRHRKRPWQTLEDELCGWVPSQSRSPNGLDALVWGAWHLRPPDGGTAPWTPSTPVTSRFGDADPRAPIAPAADPRRPTRTGMLRRS